MIGASPIGSAPIGSYSGEGFVEGLTYDFAAETSPPTLFMQINIAYDIAGETSPPALAMTATLQCLMNIAGETAPPTLEMTLSFENFIDFAAETKAPTLSMTFSNGIVINFAAETAPPILAMSIIQDLVYAISGETTPPLLLMTLSGPAVTIAAGETTAWCVNMTTGGHSRYTDYPDASGVSAINAYALTGVTDFGDSHEKYCPDIFVHCRLPDNGITIDTITDEWIERTGYEIEPCDSVQGLTRRRRKLAKGIKGQNWQYRFNNISSGGFTIKSAEPVIVKSQRRV